MAQKKSTHGKGSAPGWRIPDEVRDQFSAWCDRHKGRTYEDEAAKALFVWTRLPALMREWVELAMAGEPEYGPSFWEVFEESFDEAAHALRKRLRDGGT